MVYLKIYMILTDFKQGFYHFRKLRFLFSFVLGNSINYLEKIYFNADPSCLKRIVGEVSLYSLLKDCTSLKELHHKCKRAELLPYLNDENGKPWRIPFKTIRIKE